MTSDTVIVHGISTVGPDVLLPGVLHAGIRDWDAHVLAIDRADGNERWVTFTDHPRTPFSAANDIAVTSDEQTLVLTGAGYWPLSQDADVLTAALDMETGEHEWVAYWNNDEIPSIEAWYDSAQYVLLDPDEEHALSLAWTGKVFEGYDYEIIRHDLNRPAGALTYASAAQDVVWNVER